MMNPIRREMLNGLFVLVISTLLSAAIAAFEIKFNLQLWVLIVIGVAVAVSGYVTFEIALGAITSGEDREKEWLKRVGTPARLDLRFSASERDISPYVEAVKSMGPGVDLTIMNYATSERSSEGQTAAAVEGLKQFFGVLEERLKRGTVREYKRLICFDRDVLEKDHELKSGILRVGKGPGTIGRQVGEHCRFMMQTKGCSVYVAPVVLRGFITLYGTDKASMSVETADQETGARRTAGVMFFYDPPNGEIIEQLRQIERMAERRMVAVHKIVFPEDREAHAEVPRLS